MVCPSVNVYKPEDASQPTVTSEIVNKKEVLICLVVNFLTVSRKETLNDDTFFFTIDRFEVKGIKKIPFKGLYEAEFSCEFL